MKRKFIYIGFSFLLGLIVFSIGWGEYIGLISIISAVLVIGLFCFLKEYRIYALVCGVIFFFAIEYSQLFTYFHYDKIMQFSDKKVTVNGYIADYNYLGSDNGMLTIKGKINGGESTEITFWVPDDNYKYYDEVEIKGTVTAIENSIDYHSKNYYKSKGIYLRGKIVDEITIFNKNNHSILRAIKEYRDYMFKMINNVVGGQEGATLSAMLCGDKSEMDTATKNTFYKIGLGHIFAVSGTHLMVIVMLFLIIFKGLSLGRRLRVVLTVIIIWIFVIFSGCSPSVIRSGIMMTIMSVSQLFNRESDCLNTMGLCCIILTIGNPYIVRNPSFALSMTGAFGMGVVAPYFTSRIKIKGLLRPLISSFIAIISMMFVSIPIFMLFFNQISIIGPLANLIFVPICTIAISITVLVAITGGVEFIAMPVLKTAGVLIKFVLYISEKITSIEYTSIVISKENLKVIIVFICLTGFICLALIKSTKNRILISLAVYLSFICVYNINRIIMQYELHIIIIHDKKVSQALIYQDFKGAIIDFNAKGEHNYALQQLCDNNGVLDINAVITTSEPYYTKMQYKYSMYPKPQKIIGDFDNLECEKDKSLYNIKHFNFNGLNISWNENNYCIYDENVNISVEENGFIINDEVYKYDYDYIFDILIVDNHYEVRRIDYGTCE